MCPLISDCRREMSLQALLKFEGLAITCNCLWVLPVLLSRRLHRSRPHIPGTLGRAPTVLRHVAVRVSPTFVDKDSTNFLKHCFVVSCLFVHIRVCFQAHPPLDRSAFWCCLCCSILDVRSGLSMETLVDPGRRFVQERNCGRVGLHQR